jgi:hypothetical protein
MSVSFGAVQLLVYDALGFTPPVFGHMSLILAPDKSKLSKRHGATSVGDFKAQVRLYGRVWLRSKSLCTLVAWYHCCIKDSPFCAPRSHQRGKLQGTGAARFGRVWLHSTVQNRSYVA